MEKDDVKTGLPKTIPINIKISDKMREWLRTNKYSPTKVFGEACKELGFKE